MINRPTDTAVDDVVPRWGLVVASPPLVFGGGPVSVNGAICLARAVGELPRDERGASVDDTPDEPRESGFQLLSGSLGTVDLHCSPEDVPVRLAEARVFAGYAGWSAGQLDAEIDERAWFVAEAEEADVFDNDPDGLWARVLRRQGGWLSVLARHPLDPSVN